MLYSLTHPDELIDPFTNKGNSHNFSILINSPNVNNIKFNNLLTLSNNDIPGIVRTHPKSAASDDLQKNIYKLLDKVEKIIIVYPSKDTYLLNINNYFYKIWDDMWNGPLNYININHLYDNFPIAPNTPLNKIAPWIVREFLSYNLFTSWESQVEWYLPDHFNNNRCLFVFVNEILNQPLSVLTKIQKFQNLNWARPINNILPYHKKNLSLQKYLHQDQICCDIIDTVLSNKNFVWQKDMLTLPSEAWVQWRLRNLGYGIQCHGLDMFPTNSVQLKKLIYKL
jgi:hypothetical protein